MPPKNRRTITVQLNTDNEPDATILDWFESIPYGQRSESLRLALMRGIDQDYEPPKTDEEITHEFREAVKADLQYLFDAINQMHQTRPTVNSAEFDAIKSELNRIKRQMNGAIIPDPVIEAAETADAETIAQRKESRKRNAW